MENMVCMVGNSHTSKCPTTREVMLLKGLIKPSGIGNPAYPVARIAGGNLGATAQAIL